MKTKEDSISNNSVGFIEEYQEIRAEIRHYLERRSKSTHFAFIITAAVVGVPQDFRTGFLFLIASMIIAFIWYDEYRRIMAVFRLAAYLEIVVEPRVDGFNWETLGGLHPIQTSFLDRVLSNGVFPLTFLIHSITAFYLFNWDLIFKICLAILFILIFTFLLIKSYKAVKYGRTQEINAWKKIINDSAQEDA